MVNQGTVLGRVGRIESKCTSSGIKITNLSIATTKRFTKDGEKKEKVTWHNVTLFSKLAEIAEQYVSKGDLLYVQGEMDNQTYTTQDGLERTKFFILGSDIKLMPKNKEQAAQPSPSAQPKGADSSFVDDDIPW